MFKKLPPSAPGWMILAALFALAPKSNATSFYVPVIAAEVRTCDVQNPFLRASTPLERHRMWPNATSESGLFSQMLLSYMTGATMGIDYAIDGAYFNDGAIALNSLIDGVDYVIQGRPLPFDENDVVPLSFEAASPGNYTIAIDHMDGFFLLDQDIFIRDQWDGSIHDLKAGPYTFACDAGYFAERFQIVYRDTPLLAVGALREPDAVVTTCKDGNLGVRSGNVPMQRVQIFDLLGRLLVDRAVEALETTIGVPQTRQVLIVKVITANGTVTKKVIN